MKLIRGRRARCERTCRRAVVDFGEPRSLVRAANSLTLSGPARPRHNSLALRFDHQRHRQRLPSHEQPALPDGPYVEFTHKAQSVLGWQEGRRRLHLRPYRWQHLRRRL